MTISVVEAYLFATRFWQIGVVASSVVPVGLPAAAGEVSFTS
jgi:hypothetical protein